MKAENGSFRCHSPLSSLSFRASQLNLFDEHDLRPPFHPTRTKDEKQKLFGDLRFHFLAFMADARQVRKYRGSLVVDKNPIPAEVPVNWSRCR